MLLVGTMVRMIVAFAFVVYIARYLGVTGYGKFALTQQLYDLSTSLAATGLCILVTREAAKDIRWLRRNLASIGLMTVIVSCCATCILAGIARFAPGYAADTRQAMYIAAIAIIPASLCTVAESIFVALHKAEMVAAGIAIEALVRIGLWFIMLLSGFGLLSLFVVVIATRTAQLGLYWILLTPHLKHVCWRVSGARLWWIKRAWRVFAAETWLANLYLSLDMVFLSLFYGEAAVGLYDAAWKLIRFGPVIASCFTTAVFPYISRLYVVARDTFQLVSEQSVKYLLAGILPAVLCIHTFADKIVVFLYAEQYSESADVLRILAWLLIPQFLNPFLSRVLYARGQQRRSLAVAAIGLATFLSVAFFLIPKWGAVGTAWTLVITYYAALAAFLGFAMAGTDHRPLLAIFVRQAAAAALLAAAMIYLKHTQIFPMLVASAMLYAASLLVLRIITLNDLKLLQELR
jgi:O-antigen/teichoic acid export membrane protein